MEGGDSTSLVDMYEDRGQTFLDSRLRSSEHDLQLVLLAPGLCAVSIRVTNSC